MNRRYTYQTDRHGRRTPLTCIIAAQGADGCAIIADTRVMRELEVKDNESKIYPLWDRVVVAGSGNTALCDKFAELVLASQLPTVTNMQNIIDNIEDIMSGLFDRYKQRMKVEDYDLQTIVMGLEQFNSGEPYLRLVHQEGVSEKIKDYAIIGHGAPYAIPLFRLLYEEMLTASELSVLGWFVISMIARQGMDQTVGVNVLGPQAVILRTNEVPEFISPSNEMLESARNSLENLDFRYRLVRNIWRQIPQAYENLDSNLF